MKVKEAGIFEVKTHLSEIISEVEKGGVTYYVTKRGKKVAEIKPLELTKKQYGLPFGYAKGSVRYIAPDFDEPLEDFKDYM